jgi:hypothetical protein
MGNILLGAQDPTPHGIHGYFSAKMFGPPKQQIHHHPENGDEAKEDTLRHGLQSAEAKGAVKAARREF